MKKTVFNTVAITGLNKILVFFVSIFLVNTLTVESFGIYSFYFNLINLTAMFILLGFPQLIVREFSINIKNTKLLSELYYFANYLTLRLSLIAILFLFFCLFFLYDSSNYEESAAPLISLIMIPLVVYTALKQAMIRGFGDIVGSIWPILLVQPIVLSLILLSLIFLEIRVNSILAFFFLIISYLAISMLYHSKSIKTFSKISGAKSFTKENSKTWIRSLVPFFLIGGVNILLQRSDLLLVGVFLSFEDVSHYMIAIQIAAIINIPILISNTIFEPKIAEYFGSKQKDKLLVLYFKILFIVFLTSLFLLISFYLFGKLFLEFFYGASYLISFDSIIILGAAFTIASTLGPAGSYLSMMREEKKVLFGTFLGLVVNIALNFILIPELGIKGAAIGTSISIIFMKLIYIFYLVPTLSSFEQKNNE